MNIFRRIVTALITTICVGVCTVDADSGAAAISSNQQTQPSSHLYLRCNTTSWELNEKSRLQPVDIYTSELVYEVSETWMLGEGDSCILSEVSVNQYGEQNWKEYGLLFKTALDVDGDGDWGRPQLGAGQFRVRYFQPGKYKVRVFWRDPPSITITPVPEDEWSPNPGTPIQGLSLGYGQQTSDIAAGWQGVAYVAQSNGQVYRSVNGNMASPDWELITRYENPWFPVGDEIISLPTFGPRVIAVSPHDYNEAYIGFARSHYYPGLMKAGSDEEGLLWQPIFDVPPIVAISFNPLDPAIVYVVSESGQVFQSNDHGETWSSDPLSDPLAPPLAAGERISAAQLINHNPDHVWVGTTEGRVFATFNASGAQNWQLMSRPNMPATPVTSIASNPKVLIPPEVYVTYFRSTVSPEPEAIWVTRNGGQAWLEIDNPDLPSWEQVFGAIAIHPLDDSVLFVSGSTGGSGKSNDRGLTWRWFD